jgi:hypothetical protein
MTMLPSGHLSEWRTVHRAMATTPARVSGRSIWHERLWELQHPPEDVGGPGMRLRKG